MSKEILKCGRCCKYTLSEECCNVKTLNVSPAKFSPEDRWGRYRRMAKKLK